MTPPEVALWSQLRGSKLGFKVRRQHPIGPYVARDGSSHDFGDRPARDAVRDRYMIERGYRVIRLAAVDVMRDLDAALQSIVEQVTNPLHHSSDGSPPHAGEDK